MPGLWHLAVLLIDEPGHLAQTTTNICREFVHAQVAAVCGCHSASGDFGAGVDPLHPQGMIGQQ